MYITARVKRWAVVGENCHKELIPTAQCTASFTLTVLGALLVQYVRRDARSPV